MKRKRIITIIRKSCLTGKAVWIYQGPSSSAARLAYWRACKKEVEQMGHWAKIAASRCANVARLMADCMKKLPTNAELTPKQVEAARQLQAIGKADVACHRDFYDHIMEERRRRQEDKEIRNRMRNENNCDYDKQQ